MGGLHLIDGILILLIAAAVVFAVRRQIINRKKGGCSCGCADCASAACPGRKQPDNKGK